MNLHDIYNDAKEILLDEGFGEPSEDINKHTAIYELSDGYYTINNVQAKTVKSYFLNDVSNIIHLDKLCEILDYLDKRLFLQTSGIYMIKDIEDLDNLETQLEREINPHFLGLTTYDINLVAINILAISKSLNKQDLFQHEFENGFSEEFFLTLLHELGHSAIFNEYLPQRLLPFSENEVNSLDDEEDLVESFAKRTMKEICAKYNIQDIFNWDYILEHYWE